MSPKASAILSALAAAVLYAVNVPASKILMKNIPAAFMAASIFLMMGINVGTSSNASLQGNLEIAAAALIAMMFFGEAVSRIL